MDIENHTLNELSTGVLVLDKTLKVLLINSSAQTLLDVTQKNAKDDFIGNLFFEEPESFTVFKECLEDRRSFTKVDALLNLKSGRTLLCDYQLTPTSNFKGNNSLLVEITSKEFSSEIKERLRNQTNQRITTDFIRGLAHEIKNPLSGIRGSAQLLSNKLEEESLKEYTNLIINQTDRLSALVDDILGPNRKPNFERENIHNILEDIISLTKNEMDAQGISISRDYDPSIPELIIDNYLLEQGVLNLLKNAKEALIDSETLSPKIGISTRILHQEFLGNSFYSTVCSISITDNGPVGWSVFLDEIGDMPLETQTRLLRVLSSGEFYRVGGREPIKVDVRIIAATHQKLEDKVLEGEFREDLFHRINVIRINLPKLSDRREDIPQLCRHFFKVSSSELEEELKFLSEEVENYFMNLTWPGNVRQLENMCRLLTVMSPSREIRLEDLPDDLKNETVAVKEDWTTLLKNWADNSLSNGEEGLLNIALPEFEKTMIKAALNKTLGRKNEAAKLLGWGRNTLTRKIKELNLN